MCLGVPGQIIEITDAERDMAMAEISGVRREVSLACVSGGKPESALGKWVLIHVGFAMAVIDEAEAEKTMAALRELGEAQEALEAIEEGAKAMQEARP